ncbi:protein arginine methyltransferase NDUFAF7, mitochondrial-like isoform X2 [Amphiura filiformis]|uniref:protein arginine methyltransferase NDUFAF7, mitochondrial-like isoform X2 n=1 Tax=Amphiura filiformis TaxID=82378 RepID=UPI003B22284F
MFQNRAVLIKVGSLLYRNASIRDLNGIKQCAQLYSSKSGETKLLTQLTQRIKTVGPITVADYMKEVLTNPVAGYYMSKDVFGSSGDFTTSPEISQMFGELLAVWVIYEWTQLGSPEKLQVVELGPGRGTLADDMLRVFKQLQHVAKDAVSLHLVEVSPKMSAMQEAKLTGAATSEGSDAETNPNMDGIPYRTAISQTGVPVSWYTHISQVPKGFSCFIAHEFFDALPVHKFQKTDKGWREVMVDIDEGDGPHHLRFVLAPGPTIASKVFTKDNEKRDHVEICPQAGVITQEMAARIEEDGGMGLIVDYGHDGTKTDTIRGFKKHALHDVLSEPGTADLTADVDFSYIREMVQQSVCTFGPVNQNLFLQQMGIETRLKKLLTTQPEQHKELISGYRMLMDPEQMGQRFKMFSLMPKNRADGSPYNPAGFAIT